MTQNNTPAKKNNIWYFMSTMSIILGAVIVFFSLLSLSSNYQILTGHELLPLAVGFELQIIGIALVIFGKTKTLSHD